MSVLNRLTERVIRAVEEAEFLDAPAGAASRAVTRLLPPGRPKDLLSGTWLGHALHPALVVVPIGSWAGALYLDLRGRQTDRTGARRLVGMGAAAALPAIAAGVSDWSDTLGAERRVGFVHALVNNTSLLLFTLSWVARRRGNQAAGVGAAVLGAGFLGLGAWLGGHLSYARGVGVDTTAFEVLPEEWTDVAAVDEVTTAPLVADAGGVAVMLLREGDRIRALQDRCTHRGGPLHEGEIADGCVTCPWHGSRFRLSDGAVVRGPATRPEPAPQVRTVSGRVQVRRFPDEPGSLRQNPVMPPER
ncbi:Rieske 2Fe-2S domain-containing protein [Naasia sp. SYSU D00057]|uniref:Rieske 2Fe-2S domain-containing protein n=1 Tax=Naasia sp. SYSU D00057 TaxID=2817380 RepID=UPI001B30DCE5|nr:Rieske 2Fe-2S domain-containing protein [Naasia sp. SYSU D00057]